MEQGFDDSLLDEGFAELPDGLRIGNLVAALQPEKPPEAQPVGDLVLHLVIRKAVKALQDQDLKHHRAIERGTAHPALVCRRGERDIENRGEDVPVDVRVEFHQRILQFRQAFQEKMLVEKAQGIDVLHGRGSDRVNSAIKYEISAFFG